MVHRTKFGACIFSQLHFTLFHLNSTLAPHTPVQGSLSLQASLAIAHVFFGGYNFSVWSRLLSFMWPPRLCTRVIMLGSSAGCGSMHRNTATHFPKPLFLQSHIVQSLQHVALLGCALPMSNAKQLLVMTRQAGPPLILIRQTAKWEYAVCNPGYHSKYKF